MERKRKLPWANPWHRGLLAQSLWSLFLGTCGCQLCCSTIDNCRSLECHFHHQPTPEGWYCQQHRPWPLSAWFASFLCFQSKQRSFSSSNYSRAGLASAMRGAQRVWELLCYFTVLSFFLPEVQRRYGGQKEKGVWPRYENCFLFSRAAATTTKRRWS